MINIDSLLSLLDDEVLVRKYLVRFTEDMPGLLRQMRLAYDAQQWNEISIHAHSYKCQMQYVNENFAANISIELEKKSSSSSPNPTEIDMLISQLENQLESTLAEIKQIIE